MRKIDIGQTISTLANIGVIAGIVVLVLELQQNNVLMEAQARAAGNQVGLAGFTAVYSNPGLAAAMAKYAAGEELTPAERVQITWYVMSVYRIVEANYGEIARGMLGETVSILKMRAAITGWPAPYREAWELYKSGATPEFVSWFEEKILSAAE